jgi:hypothetical protein
MPPKLAILTCFFYWILCVAVIAAYEYDLVYAQTAFVRFRGPHPLLGAIISFGVLFGGMWIVSYCAAWCIAYRAFKRKLP